MADRLDDTIRFYLLLDELAELSGGMRCLADCSGRMGWPRRGVCFFSEHRELRTGSGTASRVVRIGTHALKARSEKYPLGTPVAAWRHAGWRG